MTTRGRWGALLAIAAIVSAFSPGVCAQSCEPAAASVISIQGDVEVSESARADWQHVRLNQVLCGGQQVRLRAKSRAVLQLPNETLIHLDEGSVVTLRAIEREKPAWLDLLRGTLHIISRVPRALNIRTPFVNAGTEGTEFALQVGNAETALWVYEGRVRFSNTLGQLVIASGEAAAAAPPSGASSSNPAGRSNGRSTIRLSSTPDPSATLRGCGRRFSPIAKTISPRPSHGSRQSRPKTTPSASSRCGRGCS